MLQRLLILTLSVLVPCICWAAPEGGKQWLLAVGIINFADTRIPQLAYCVKDAEVLADYYRQVSTGNAEVILLKNEDATREGVLAGLARLKSVISPEDTVIFFYSSHGIGDPEGNTYFVTFDTNKDDLANTALPMQEIKKMVSDIGARDVVMLFDTCHSGGAKSLPQQNENNYDNLMLAASKKTRMAILMSSRTHELSMESPEWGHGVFTYFLLEGLRGRADDFPPDGKISVTELFDYVTIAVPRATDRAQHPTSKFSYNWPGSKMDPVHIGRSFATTAAAPQGIPGKDNTARKKSDDNPAALGEQWHDVLAPASE
jgi:uncharacterized caspase-like protein